MSDVRDYLKETLARALEERMVPFSELDRIEKHIRSRKALDRMKELSQQMQECDLSTSKDAKRWRRLSEEWDRARERLDQLNDW